MAEACQHVRQMSLTSLIVLCNTLMAQFSQPQHTVPQSVAAILAFYLAVCFVVQSYTLSFGCNEAGLTRKS